MKYTVQSTKYVFKNFIYLIPFAILPAIFLAISTDEIAITAVVKSIFKGNIEEWSFVELFRAISILNFATWPSIVFGLVGIIVIVPCVAMMMALLEKHMRIGKRTFNGILGKLNDNLISTCGTVLLLLGIYELWTLLFTSVLFLVSRISIVILAYILAAIVFIVFHVLLMLSVSTVYLWLPCMQITGFRAYEALVYSYHLIGKIKWRVIAAQLCVLLFAEILISACAVLLPTSLIFNIIVAVLFSFIIMLYCVRMQIAYFDRDHIERADIAKYYQR